jgi:hypothetical protein
MTMKRRHSLVLLAAISLAFGCDSESSRQEGASASKNSSASAAKSATSAESPGPATAPALPESLFAAAAPSDAPSLSEARASAEKGATVSFVAYVGGRREPFVAGRAIMLVADAEAAPACGDGEGCQTPWDACCVPIETKTANSATVQVVDAQGQPLKVGLEGAGPLKPGAKIVVVGVAREASADLFVVDATSIGGA